MAARRPCGVSHRRFPTCRAGGAATFAPARTGASSEGILRHVAIRYSAGFTGHSYFAWRGLSYLRALLCYLLTGTDRSPQPICKEPHSAADQVLVTSARLRQTEVGAV